MNGGTPKSSIVTGLSTINHPFWGTPIYGNHIISYPVHRHFWIQPASFHAARAHGIQDKLLGIQLTLPGSIFFGWHADA